MQKATPSLQDPLKGIARARVLKGGGCFCGNLFPDVEGDPEVLDFRISDRMQFPERLGQD